MKHFIMWLRSWFGAERPFHDMDEELQYQASMQRSREQAIFYRPTG